MTKGNFEGMSESDGQVRRRRNRLIVHRSTGLNKALSKGNKMWFRATSFLL